MTTATATATTERAFTIREALALNDALLWRAVEEFQIHLGEPRLCGGRWLAGCLFDGRRVLEFGDSPEGAVRRVLEVIGGING